MDAINQSVKGVKTITLELLKKTVRMGTQISQLYRTVQSPISQTKGKDFPTILIFMIFEALYSMKVFCDFPLFGCLPTNDGKT